MVNWTEKRLKRVKTLKEDGYSAGAIARKLGPAFSKWIVLRKLRELEAERVRRAAMRAARKAAKARELAESERAAALTARTPVAVGDPTVTTPGKGGVTLLDLRVEQCRWPLDEGRPARLFCGSPTVGTTSWCQHHQRLAFAGLARAQKAQEHRRAL